MKTRISQVRLMALVGAISFSAIAASFAEDAAPAQGQTATSTAVVVDGVPTTTVTVAQTAPVIKAMIEQRKKALEAAAQIAAAAQQSAPADYPNAAVTAPLTPIYTEPAPTYVEPDYVPASTVYVIGSPAVRYAYYNSSPYY